MLWAKFFFGHNSAAGGALYIENFNGEVSHPHLAQLAL